MASSSAESAFLSISWNPYSRSFVLAKAETASSGFTRGFCEGNFELALEQRVYSSGGRVKSLHTVPTFFGRAREKRFGAFFSSIASSKGWYANKNDD